MEIRYDWNNCTYFIKEKIGNQTYRMDFNIYTESYDTAYVNIALYVYTKRKTIEQDMESKNITGHNPMATIRFARKAFEELEKRVMEARKYETIVFEVNGTDTRRSKVYERFLSKYGYTTNGHYFMKKVTPAKNPFN